MSLEVKADLRFLLSGLNYLCSHASLACTAVSSEAWAKLRDWASVAGRGRLLL